MHVLKCRGSFIPECAEESPLQACTTFAQANSDCKDDVALLLQSQIYTHDNYKDVGLRPDVMQAYYGKSDHTRSKCYLHSIPKHDSADLDLPEQMPLKNWYYKEECSI